MKRKTRIILIVLLLLFLLGGLFGGKVVLGVKKGKYKGYRVIKNEMFTSTVYDARIELTKEQWKVLRADLVEKEWEAGEAQRSTLMSSFFSEGDYQFATEQLYHYETEYYTIFPKSCLERIVVFEYDDRIELYILIAVSNPWSRAEY